MVTIVCDGNSITYGVGYGPGPTWPEAMAAMAPWASMGAGVQFYNFGVNSQTTQDMIADAATQIDPLYDPANINILIAWEIRNDVQNGMVGVTARQAIDHIKAYCLARKAVGWKVIVVDILHTAWQLQGHDPASEAQINGNYDLCNEILAAEWTDFADGYVHMLDDSRLADPYDLTVYYEGVHPNGLGRQYCAEDINPEAVRIYNEIIGLTPNLKANKPNVAVSKQWISFADAGINSTNTHIIYEIGAAIKSYVPGRPINAVSSFTGNQGYYIVPKIDLFLNDILVPPI